VPRTQRRLREYGGGELGRGCCEEFEVLREKRVRSRRQSVPFWSEVLEGVRVPGERGVCQAMVGESLRELLAGTLCDSSTFLFTRKRQMLGGPTGP
jgi:hypothetical protein